MEAVRLWLKQEELVALWHAYRIPLLVLISLALLTARKLSSYRLVLQEVISGPETVGRPQLPIPTPEVENAANEQPLPAPMDEKPYKGIRSSERALHKPRRIKGSRSIAKAAVEPSIASSNKLPLVQPILFFSSLTGSTEAYAKSTLEKFRRYPLHPSILDPRIHDLSYQEYDDYFVSTPNASNDRLRYFYLIIVPTYNVDTLLDSFILHLQETHHDFRVDTAPLSGLLGYSVFGFGDKEGWPSEDEGFCSQARDIDRWMAKLTNCKRAFPLGLGDVKSDAKERLDEWYEGIEETLRAIAETGNLGEGVPGSGDAIESNDEEEDEGRVETEPEKGNKPRKKHRKLNERSLDDLEDLGRSAASNSIPVDFTTSKPKDPLQVLDSTPKSMVPATSPTYAALTKQGYSIIGSHSGVKICRWTKSALRGRGSCYKRSFYGIASHLCMEATPSLSCSNKCVFCWRHGTNPVGTTWRWQVDPPELIFQGAKEAHLKKIKSMRGVPGVRAERFQEAQRIRHCALSLVGEPIFYPHINAFLSLLHAEHISSFLVCNAQHPAQLAALDKVTQLYVSIDASNRDSLRRIDRPLHRDFWERFLQCLEILRERRFRMRTVFRLTLVKGFNIEDEVIGYADLVAKGLPCFVEIKGVTYCGTSTSASAGLTMANVPFYEEVSSFVVALNDELNKRGLEYGIAAEHAHSCCVLLASTRFRRQGKWHTLIDYDKFYELLESGEEFGPEDYMGEPTPEWALWGNGGFDPADERVARKGKKLEDAPQGAKGREGETVSGIRPSE